MGKFSQSTRICNRATFSKPSPYEGIFSYIKKNPVFVSNVNSAVWLWLEWEGMVNANEFNKCCRDTPMFCIESLISNTFGNTKFCHIFDSVILGGVDKYSNWTKV